MKLTRKLIKRANGAGILVHAHINGYILCDNLDDDDKPVEITDCEDFLDTVICTLKTYRFRDGFFTAIPGCDDEGAAEELTDYLDFIYGVY